MIHYCRVYASFSKEKYMLNPKIKWSGWIGALLFSSCSYPSFQIVDRSGLEVAVEKISLEPGPSLYILDGESERWVPLKDIQKLTIDPSKFRSYKNKLFYQAVVVLSDGSQIKPRKGKTSESAAYVNVDSVVKGMSKAGPVEIKMENVNVMKQIQDSPSGQ